MQQVFLAMEERDPNALSTATHLIETFDSNYLHLQYTIHPADTPYEAPGKSSNISWAANAVQRKYHNHPQWRNVLITVMDSESVQFQTAESRSVDMS